MCGDNISAFARDEFTHGNACFTFAVTWDTLKHHGRTGCGHQCAVTFLRIAARVCFLTGEFNIKFGGSHKAAVLRTDFAAMKNAAHVAA